MQQNQSIRDTNDVLIIKKAVVIKTISVNGKLVTERFCVAGLSILFLKGVSSYYIRDIYKFHLLDLIIVLLFFLSFREN